MEKAQGLLDSVHRKIMELKSKYEALKLENQELINYNNELEELVKQQQTELKIMRENQGTVIPSQASEAIIQKKEMGEKIDRIVREIDKCISLLNK
jgi:hypothetical protein